MRNQILNIINLKQFFKVIKSTEETINYTLEKPSRLLMQNIYKHWLHSLYSKTNKQFPIYLKESLIKNEKLPLGWLSCSMPEYTESKVFSHSLSEYTPKITTELKFNLVVPKQDIMQYFFQWQRYRKYWWSSVTTTPSLFAIKEINYGDQTADVDIVAQFPWAHQTVETVAIDSNGNTQESSLSCTTTLEGALFILLLDGFTNYTKEEYLRLHRKMAPYKFSFALDCKDENKQALTDLATLIHHRIENNKISAWLPNFSLSLPSQLKENLHIGVAYTAILSDNTLNNGIFHLMSSSTMLKEQVHIFDFDNYAALLCEK